MLEILERVKVFNFIKCHEEMRKMTNIESEEFNNFAFCSLEVLIFLSTLIPRSPTLIPISPHFELRKFLLLC